MAHSLTPVDITPQLYRCLDALPTGASVLDVGCSGWKLQSARPDLAHHGCDLEDLTPPSGAIFKVCNIDLNSLPWPDDCFDLVVASHLLEHLTNPIKAFEEIVRVSKPSGYIYLEMPSDRAALVNIRNAGFAGFYNFWDDPTHRRPWSPRSIFRLMLGCNCFPVEIDYIGGSFMDKAKAALERIRYIFLRDEDRLTHHWWLANQFICFGIGRKPSLARGKQPFHYVSLKGKTTEGVIENLEEKDGASE